jgi:hypothetical protein
VVDGSAHDVPLGTIAPDRLPAGLERLTNEAAQAQRRGERAAEVLARLGAEIVAATIAGESGHA